MGIHYRCSSMPNVRHGTRDNFAPFSKMSSSSMRTTSTKWFISLRKYARKSAAELADFLHRQLKLTPKGQLLYANDTSIALDFVTGLLPASLCMFLRSFAQTNEDIVRKFFTHLRRSCSRLLWWPIWSISNKTTADTTDDSSYSDHFGLNDTTGYCSDSDDDSSTTSDN